jgi:hypothetical protein
VQHRPGSPVRLPLLLQHLLDLRPGERLGDDVVRERLDGERVRVGDRAVRAVLEVGPQPARVHQRDLRAAATGLAGLVELDVGDEVAHHRLDAAVLGAAGVTPQDVRGDLAERPLAELRGVRLGGGHDGRDLRVRGGADNREQLGGGRGHRTGGRVVGQHGLAELFAVVLRLDDRAGPGGAGDRHLEGVRLVGVAAEDGVDLGADPGEVTEDRVGHQVGRRTDVLRRRTLMGEQHQHVGLAVRVVAVRELGGQLVRLGHRVAELHAGDAVRTDQRTGLLGDHADVTHPDAAQVLHRVAGQHPLVAGVDVRGQVREVGPVLDPAQQIGQALVELVVTDRRDVQATGVQRVDRRVVRVDRGDERRRPDVVAGGDPRGVRVGRPQLVDQPDELGRAPDGLAAGGRRRLEPPVEVVDAEQLQVDRRGEPGLEADHDGVVVAGPVRAVVVERRVDVVLVGVRLDGVDVPDVHPGDPVRERRGGQPVVE